MALKKNVFAPLVSASRKSGESVRQWLGTTDGGQCSLMLKSALVGWRELVATSGQARMMEKLKEENPAYKAKIEAFLRCTFVKVSLGVAGLKLAYPVRAWLLGRTSRPIQACLRCTWHLHASLNFRGHFNFTRLSTRSRFTLA